VFVFEDRGFPFVFSWLVHTPDPSAFATSVLVAAAPLFSFPKDGLEGLLGVSFGWGFIHPLRLISRCLLFLSFLVGILLMSFLIPFINVFLHGLDVSLEGQNLLFLRACNVLTSL
jgi:hypothetical protein